MEVPAPQTHLATVGRFSSATVLYQLENLEAFLGKFLDCKLLLKMIFYLALTAKQALSKGLHINCFF